MANTVYTASTLSNLSYDDLISWINVAGENPQLDAYIQEAAKYGVSEMQAVEDLAGTYMNFYKNEAGQYTITSFNNTAQMTNVSPIDSNMSTVARSNVQTPLNRSVDPVTNKIKITKFPASGSFAQRAGYVLGSVGSAYAAASTGITLGKIISPSLYDIAPNFWDAWGISESSFDPATWSGLTNGADSWQAGLLNFILGIDPDTGNSQMYMDENAFAYMAGALASAGMFDTSDYAYNDGSGYTLPNLIPPSYGYSSFKFKEGTRYHSQYVFNINNGLMCLRSFGRNGFTYCIVSTQSSVRTVYTTTKLDWYPVGETSTYTDTSYLHSAGTFNGVQYYYLFGTWSITDLYDYADIKLTHFKNTNSLTAEECACILNGSRSAVPGISDQQNATLPTNFDTWTTPQAALDSLKQQYPDLWDNALIYDNVQPDGTNPQKVYIPVATPTATSALDDAPLGGDATQTQANTQIQPAIDPQTLLQLITSVATQPNPQVQTAPDTITQPTIPNPVDTGDGGSPVPVAPTGSASALWSVYHPTQQQVNDFGGWLWSSNFIDQLLRMFQNPMDAVVSLRKVFVTPVDAGVSTIHAGYLDSQVPSSYITQQYVFKDCGTIDCYEQFGNVFDYINTEISMYLPFIGIVPLNTSEVMRSQLHVVYGVDMFTGACLASIEVIRDGNTVTMYQYAGNASVEYPLSGQRASSFLGGLMSLGGAAASIATGGGSVVAAGAAISGMSQMSTVNVSHSGSFSGNAGAMGIKKPYLIIERPQTKVASNDEYFTGYSNNYSGKVSDFSGMVKARKVHVLGINATDGELAQIENLLKDGIII